MPGVELRIAADEEGGDGAGEIQARGPNVFRYHVSSQASREPTLASAGTGRTVVGTGIAFSSPRYAA